MNGNATDWFLDRNIREGRAEKAAFIEAWGGGRTITYGDLANSAGCCASALQSAGVEQNARAAMFVLDQIEFPIIFWGALKAGVQPIALNTLLATDVYLSILNDSAASIAFVSHALLDVVLP
ncbi:MAG: AMP-binding protein, partial [Paracoccaceae bacterium]